MAQVEDFVEFLAQGDDRQLTQAPRGSLKGRFGRSGTVPPMPLTTGFRCGDAIIEPILG